jgi:uncharacterized protein YndB with AHSA1/START domain
MLISKSIQVYAAVQSVWNALINPDKIARYFTGAETATDWKVGRPVVFTHQYEGQTFHNKGTVLDFVADKLLRYTYWTAFSHTEDIPENYTTITWQLAGENDTIILSLTQTNFKNEEWFRNLETGWNTVLLKIKEIAEEDNK